MNAKEAKIEIVARPIQGFEKLGVFAPHHLYILITMSNGDRTAIRGGPAKGNEVKNWLFDDLKVIKSCYNEHHPDWNEYGTDPKHVVAHGDDAYINSIINNPNFQKTFDGINNGNFDYKVAIPHLDLFAAFPYLNLLSKITNFNSQQNSNTAARVCIEAMGLKFVSPGYLVKGKFIHALSPGVNQENIGDTLYDSSRKIGKKLYDQLDISNKAEAFAEWYSKEFKTTTTRAKEAYVEYLKFMGIGTRDHKSDAGETQDSNIYTKTESSSSDPGSNYKPWTREFWENSDATLSQKQKDLFQSYKPKFSGKPIFDFNDPFAKTNLINEPLWLYGNRKDDSVVKQFEVINEFRQSVKSCLGDPFCKDTISSLIQKASSKESDNPSFFLRMQPEMKMAADQETKSFLSNLYKSATLDSWAYPLRNELKYAASHVSPLVLDLNGDGVKLLPYTNGVYFDIDNDGFAERVGWTSAEDGQLARDLNQNGRIDDITELFGDDQISAFFKLSLLDSNNDKVIDEKDEDFKELLIWQDKNLNGYSEPEELKTLKEAKIQSISLNTQRDDRVIEGNRISATSTFRYEDGREGVVADVHYHNDDMDSWYQREHTSSKSEEKQYFEDRKRFRKKVLEKLSEKIQNPDNLNKGSDWVAEVIQFEANQYIIEYNNQKTSDVNNFLAKLEGLNQNKKFESKKACTTEKERLGEEANQRYAATKEEAKAQLLEEIQAKLDQQKENINSRHTQEYVKLKESLYNEINVRLRDVNKETYQKAVDEKWTQEQYNQATEANKARLSEEYNSQKDILYEQHTQAASLEIDRDTEEYSKEYAERFDKISTLLKLKELSNLEEKTHEQDQSCAIEEKGIQSVLADQYVKYREVTKESIEQFENAIKQEGNNVYEYFINKVIKQANFTESTTYSDSPSNNHRHEKTNFGEISDWVKDEYFNSQQNNNTGYGNYHYGVKIDPETLFMPFMRGHGKIPALHIAMTKNVKLKDLVLDFMGLKPAAFRDFHRKIVDILYEWAEVSKIPEDARTTAGGTNIEARKVAFVEQLTGQEFKQLGVAKFVGQHASTAVQKAWDIALRRATKHLLIQGPLIPLFPKAEYSFLDDKTYLNSALDDILSASKDFADRHNLGYDFWVQLGYILVPSTHELISSIEEINSKLSELAGTSVLLDTRTFGLTGDDNPNIIIGSPGSDYIKGLGGNDKLYGKEGSDHIEGDDGDDEIYGDQGIDRLNGGNGNDKIFGGDDRDFIHGGPGNDEIYGENGDDHIDGGAGADNMDGGEGINTLSYGNSAHPVYVNLDANDSFDKRSFEDGITYATGDRFKNFQNLGGSEHNDHLVGDSKDNYINGESGDDQIEGLGGNDHLFGATGNDTLIGNDGNDILTGFEGPDHMDGGPGIDTAAYNHPYSTYGVKVDLKSGKGIGGYAHEDTYKDIENVIGSRHDDNIKGNDGNNVLRGLEGNDIIFGEGGDDIIIGGHGEDNIFGGEGDDTVYLTGDGDYANGGEGKNTVSYEFAQEPVILNMPLRIGQTNSFKKDIFEKFEHVHGSLFDDVITGDEQDNHLYGLEGNDIIKGGLGDDVLLGGKGNDMLFGEEGKDTIYGDEGEDEIDGGDGRDFVDYSHESTTGIKIDLENGITQGGIAQGDKLKNIEGIIGTKFDDILIGDMEDNYLFGQDGNDLLQGGDGDDRLSGGLGNNTLDGGLGIDFACYTVSKEGINVNLAEGKSSKDGVYEDTYIDIEGIIGSNHNDRIFGDDRSNYLYGEDGDDYINGRSGNDKISGGAGNNILEGGKGNDEFLLVEGSNQVDGGDGEDVISYAAYQDEGYVETHTKEFEFRLKNNLLPKEPGGYFTTPIVASKVGLEINLKASIVEKPDGLVDKFINVENVIGTNFDDIIIGDERNNYLVGTNGNDKIYGGKGDDKILCGWGTSELFGEEGNDYFVIKGFPANIDGGDGNDSADFINLPVSIEANLKEGYVVYNDIANMKKYKLDYVENIRGSNFDDVLYDNDAGNTIAGGQGNDKIYLTNGDDIVNGQGGKDTIYLGGGGNKQIWGGGIDSDTFVITKDFQSQNKTSTIIVDFDAGVAEDKIDLSAFSHLNKMEDLNLEQITHNNRMFTVLTIDHEKWVSLYDVNISKIHPDNFLFSNDEINKAFNQSVFDDCLSISNSCELNSAYF